MKRTLFIQRMKTKSKNDDETKSKQDNGTKSK